MPAPAAAPGLDEEAASVDAAPQDVDVVALVR